MLRNFCSLGAVYKVVRIVPKAAMETLIQRILQGDEHASSELVQAYQEPVFRLAYLILGDADDAKDAAQVAFIRAFDALDRFDTSRPLRPWLLRIVANVARTQRQAQGRQHAALQRFAQSDPDQFIAAPHA